MVVLVLLLALGLWDSWRCWGCGKLEVEHLESVEGDLAAESVEGDLAAPL